MRQFLALAAMLLLCQTVIRAQEEEKQLNVVQDIADANIQSIVRNVGQLLNKNPQQQENFHAGDHSCSYSHHHSGWYHPDPPGEHYPATGHHQDPIYLNPTVTFTQAQKNQPYVEQAGSPGLFPSVVNNAVIGINNKNFLVGPGTSRYLVIGDD
ncbi:g3334 [Coccomyxa elongata]